MLKSTLLSILLAVIVILIAPTILAVPDTPDNPNIPFNGTENRAVLNPALSWDAGDSLYNRYSVTDYPGKLLLVAAPGSFVGASVCTPVTGDFTAEVHVRITPQANRQGAGLFVRAVGTYANYIGVARYYRSQVQSVGSWGMVDAKKPLPLRHSLYLNDDVDLHLDRIDGLLNAAFKGGPRPDWTSFRTEFEFPLPDAVEVCLNTWSVENRLSASAVFDNFVVTAD